MSSRAGSIRWSNGDCGAWVDVNTYPNGEPLIVFPRDVNPTRLMCRPRSVLDLMSVLWLVDALAERGPRIPSLLLPFVSGGRQDRLNAEGDYLFTAKSVAREINLRNFPSVTILDPHSEAIAALIDRCRVISAASCLEMLRFRQVYDAIVSPDAGAEKRAAGIAKLLGKPLLHAWKTRNVANGEITGFGFQPIEPQRVPESKLIEGAYTLPRHVLVVDDICDGGGTFVGLGKLFKARGLTADLYVTHGIFSKGTDELLKYYGRILCTDSVEHDPVPIGVEVIRICDGLL